MEKVGNTWTKHNLIYTNPTIARTWPQQSNLSSSKSRPRENPPRKLENKRYEREILQHVEFELRESRARKKSPKTAVLTGSTGVLGEFESVSKIYCFNRSANSEQSQEFSSASQGLSSQWSPQRVTFLFSGFSKDD